ncbi:MAG: methionyl-tRNA formyltransferase, partial [Hyphomicrobiales bacterium]
LSPFPGAWCQSGDERLKLLASCQIDGDGSPGEVLDALTIACSSGAVSITRAQRHGKRAMDVQELLLGFTPNNPLT